jgi:NAD(P)H-flavin reductase
MPTRCPPWTSRTALRSVSVKAPTRTIRVTSSVPERQRRFPDARGAFTKSFGYPWYKIPVRPWFWVFIAGCYGIGYYNTYQETSSFSTYTLIDKEPVSSSASIFRLKAPDQAQTPGQTWLSLQENFKRSVWNLQIKQPQLQIVRAYTPLPASFTGEKQTDGEFRFLIRHDRHGEMSSYLHRLPKEAGVGIRGPFQEYEITPDIRQVVFFAGGTGIAPALQVASAMFSDQNPSATEQTPDHRRLHILWANRSREDCLGGVSDDPAIRTPFNKSSWSGLFSIVKPSDTATESVKQSIIVKELEALKTKYPGQVTVDYFVNAEDTWIDERAVSRAVGLLSDAKLALESSAPDQRQILISGPDGFIAHLAGPKEWRNGREEQGSVSRLVAHALSKSPYNIKVWKI